MTTHGFRLGPAALRGLVAAPLFAAVLTTSTRSAADCSLTSLGLVPLADLGPGTHQGHQGGLYPQGDSWLPAAHRTAAEAIANSEIVPRGPGGTPDPGGKVVMVSIGMSNTGLEFGGGASSFMKRMKATSAVDPSVVLVNGAQGGKPASVWVAPDAPVWAEVEKRLADAGVTPAQVQVAWIKHGEGNPSKDGVFPAHAQKMQQRLEAIVQNLVLHFGNIRLAFLSSRTRAYSQQGLSPEPFAYEAGFAVKWLIEKQISGAPALNYDGANGPVVAPLLSWGPYLWADGDTPRSDGFTWPCAAVGQQDYTHPSELGIELVADQLVAFFKTSPRATPWMMRFGVVAGGQAPSCAPTAITQSGPDGLKATFDAGAQDPDGLVAEYAWTFGDGGFSLLDKPTKLYPQGGNHDAHLTVTDNDGNATHCSLVVGPTNGGGGGGAGGAAGAGGAPAGGGTPGGAGGAGVDGGAPASGGADAGGQAGADAAASQPATAGGCGCHLAGTSGRTAWLAGLLLMILPSARRRRPLGCCNRRMAEPTRHDGVPVIRRSGWRKRIRRPRRRPRPVGRVTPRCA